MRQPKIQNSTKYAFLRSVFSHSQCFVSYSIPAGRIVCAKSFNVGHPARFVGVVTVLLGLGSECEGHGGGEGGVKCYVFSCRMLATQL